MQAKVVRVFQLLVTSEQDASLYGHAARTHYKNNLFFDRAIYFLEVPNIYTIGTLLIANSSVL